MTDLKSMIRLQTWLSPAFPIGAFSYSSGLEAAIDEGYVNDTDSLTTWLTGILASGTVSVSYTHLTLPTKRIV